MEYDGAFQDDSQLDLTDPRLHNWMLETVGDLPVEEAEQRLADVMPDATQARVSELLDLLEVLRSGVL